MKRRPEVAEFQHVAQNRDAPAALARLRLREQRECGAHRGGIGVVAFVDQQHFAVGDR